MPTHATRPGRSHAGATTQGAHPASPGIGKQTLVQSLPRPDLVHAAAGRGTRGPGGPLPYQDQIQRAFGRHDISGIRAHTDADATRGAQAMGAEAFATGRDVAFAGTPSLHTAAHEAAHVVQQRGGVALAGGVGAAGDEHERHADAVADAVVQGRSAEALLDRYAAPGAATGAAGQVQRKIELQGIEVEVGLPGYIEEGTAIYSPMTLAFGDAPEPGDRLYSIPGSIGRVRCIVHYITNPQQNPGDEWAFVQVPADVVETMFTDPLNAGKTKLDKEKGSRMVHEGTGAAWQGVVRRRDVIATPLADPGVGHVEYEPVTAQVTPFTPRLHDVSQRAFGTCYLQAALIAILARNRPQDIAAIQGLLGNESKTEISAFFYNPILRTRDEVRVAKALPEGIVNYTGGLLSARLTGGSAWVGLLEKAYAAWPGRDGHAKYDGSNGHRMDFDSGYEFSYPGAEGGFSRAAFEHLLGRPDGQVTKIGATDIPRTGAVGAAVGGRLPWDGRLVPTGPLLFARPGGNGFDVVTNRFDPGPDATTPGRARALPGLVLDDADRDLWGAYITQGGTKPDFLMAQLKQASKLGTVGAEATLPLSALMKHAARAGLSATGRDALAAYCVLESLVEAEGDQYTPADLELYGLIQQTLEAGGYVGLGTPAWSSEGDRDRKTVPGLPGQHAYGVIAAYCKKGRFVIEFRNPHDSIGGMLGGLFGLDGRSNHVMDIREVRRYFTDVHHYSSQPAALVEPRYPTFTIDDGTWRDGTLNRIPDALIARGVAPGQIIVVNGEQYTVFDRPDGGGREPTDLNPLGKSCWATPRLRGG